jgi:hypothetical protein
LKREGAHDLDEAVFLSDVARKDKNNKGFANEEANRGDHIKVREIFLPSPPPHFHSLQLTSLAAQDED